MAENKNRYLSRRDFLKAAATIGGSALLAGCAPKFVSAVDTPEATPTWTPFTAPTEVPTNTPEAPKPTLDERFKLGSWNVAEDKWTLHAGEDVRRALNHVFDLEVTYTADTPLKVVTKNAVDNPAHVAIFKKAEREHVLNPFWVIVSNKSELSTNSNLVLAYFHASQGSTPGMFAEDVAAFVQNNPEEKNKIIGKTVTIEVNGISIPAEIVFTNVVTREYWFSGEPWNNEAPMTVILEKLGVDPSIINDKDPNVSYLMIAGCMSKDGAIYPLHSQNIVKRAIIILKFKTP